MGYANFATAPFPTSMPIIKLSLPHLEFILPVAGYRIPASNVRNVLPNVHEIYRLFSVFLESILTFGN
jgi:hypothetical protein